MNLKKYIALLSLILTGLFLTGSVYGDSYYSSIGMGMPHYFVSPKAVGMGGAGLGVMDRFALNSMNPAAVFVQGKTTVSLDSYMEMVESKYNDQNSVTRNGNPSGFHFYVPLHSRVTFLAGLKALTRAKYNLEIDGQTDYVEYTRFVRGSGGVSAGVLGLQYLITKNLVLGANAKFDFGSFNEEWKTEFSEDAYTDAADELTSHLWGAGFELGMYLLPADWFSLGIIYHSKSKLNVEDNITLGSALVTDIVESSVNYPQALGIGTSVSMSKVQLAFDVYTQFWDQFELDGIVTKEFNNYTRIGGGMEYRDSHSYLDAYHRRIAYRLGGYFSQLPYTDVDGSTVNELFATAGLGFPFFGGTGQLDFALEYGKRSGNNVGYSENVLRFSASFSGSELWFQRRR